MGINQTKLILLLQIEIKWMRGGDNEPSPGISQAPDGDSG